jgi:hypothetical protein
MLDTRRLTLEQASELLREWQEELRLLDWNIKLRITREIAPRHGHVRICESKQCAYIGILDPSAALQEMEPLDMELALVHELLHIQLAAFMQREKKTHKDIVQEQAIHKLSQHLVRMKREMRELRERPRRRAA